MRQLYSQINKIQHHPRQTPSFFLLLLKLPELSAAYSSPWIAQILYLNTMRGRKRAPFSIDPFSQVLDFWRCFGSQPAALLLCVACLLLSNGRMQAPARVLTLLVASLGCSIESRPVTRWFMMFPETHFHWPWETWSSVYVHIQWCSQLDKAKRKRWPLELWGASRISSWSWHTEPFLLGTTRMRGGGCRLLPAQGVSQELLFHFMQC